MTNQPKTLETDPRDFLASTDILSDRSPATKIPEWVIHQDTLKTNHPLGWALFDDPASESATESAA